MSDKEVDSGNLVKANYTGKLENGQVFDSSEEDIAREAGVYNSEREYNPVEIRVGEGQLIPGFENALRGMKEGEKKEVAVPPEEAYGPKRDELYKGIGMDAFKQANIDPQEGMVLETEIGMGVVEEVKENEVMVNFNHPLAGNTLHFEIELVEIVE